MNVLIKCNLVLENIYNCKLKTIKSFNKFHLTFVKINNLFFNFIVILLMLMQFKKYL
jgi:hypothetical protein